MIITVAIDCMGGDHGPRVTVPAALDFVRKHEDVRVVLVGLEQNIRPLLGNAGQGRVSVRHASEVVAMDEPPALALRSKKTPPCVLPSISSRKARPTPVFQPEIRVL